FVAVAGTAATAAAARTTTGGQRFELLLLEDPRFLDRDVRVSGADQFAGRGALEADHFNAAAVELEALYQRHVVAVAGDQRHGVEARGHHQRVDGQADLPGALGGAAAVAAITAVATIASVAPVGLGSNLQLFDLELIAEARERLVETGLVDIRLLNDV